MLRFREVAWHKGWRGYRVSDRPNGGCLIGRIEMAFGCLIGRWRVSDRPNQFTDECLRTRVQKHCTLRREIGRSVSDRPNALGERCLQAPILVLWNSLSVSEISNVAGVGCLITHHFRDLRLSRCLRIPARCLICRTRLQGRWSIQKSCPWGGPSRASLACFSAPLELRAKKMT